MARKPKQLLTVAGLDRRSTGYYSTPSFVSEYLLATLGKLNPDGLKVIDPCIGKGEMSQVFHDAGFQVTGIDISKQKHLKHTYFRKDFIKYYQDYKSRNARINFASFDYWLANPPYNCHEVDYIKTNKKELKRLFNDVGVHNMYSMFISAIIDMAKPGALIALVTFDSFLTATFHKALRQKILQQCQIKQVLLCPINLFIDQGAHVRSCIVILQKRMTALPESETNAVLQQENVQLLNRLADQQDFIKALKTEDFVTKTVADMCLLGATDHFEFLVGVPDPIKALFANKRIKDTFHCITGISTGNDGAFLRKKPSPGFSMPFYKNPASRRFYTKPDAFLVDDFLPISEQRANFIVRNQYLLFRSGITCSSMGVEFSACYLPKDCTFGVNANIICDDNDAWWLLAYLNSELVRYLVRGVMIRTNMVTSGYVARIPLVEFSPEQKEQLTELSKQAYVKAASSEDFEPELSLINKIIYEILELAENDIKLISTFCQNIIKNT